MLFSLAILLFISLTVTAITDLQANCTGPDRRYNGTTCYVLFAYSATQDVSKISCNHYLGYSGHLVHIRNAAVQNVVHQMITNYVAFTIYCAWTGLELLNSSASHTDSSNWGYYYRNGTFFSQTYLPWLSGHPSTNLDYNRAMYCKNEDRLFSYQGSNLYSYVCEYEEAQKQPVSNLEQKCVNLMSGSVFTSFVNDVCYVLQSAVSKNYNDAKGSCNALSGYNGHLAHLRTVEKLWIAEALRLVAGASYVRLGIEQTDLSSTNASIGWYLTTPTNQSMPANFLPWATSNPTTNKRTIAVVAGYPKSFATVDSTTAYPFLCQYGRSTLSASTGTPGK
uniref:C-type lectin domain-containing protein n=1 Tax=Plectus sambesii TaxID=2011161 RepID=A0A914UWL9_9BILA